jgi:hypothetical protein
VCEVTPTGFKGLGCVILGERLPSTATLLSYNTLGCQIEYGNGTLCTQDNGGASNRTMLCTKAPRGLGGNFGLPIIDLGRCRVSLI